MVTCEDIKRMDAELSSLLDECRAIKAMDAQVTRKKRLMWACWSIAAFGSIVYLSAR